MLKLKNALKYNKFITCSLKSSPEIIYKGKQKKVTLAYYKSRDKFKLKKIYMPSINFPGNDKASMRIGKVCLLHEIIFPTIVALVKACYLFS